MKIVLNKDCVSDQLFIDFTDYLKENNNLRYDEKYNIYELNNGTYINKGKYKKYLRELFKERYNDTYNGRKINTDSRANIVFSLFTTHLIERIMIKL